MRRGLLSCPENTSRLYELLMSQLLIKYSIFVLYGREILVVIRVPPQRNAAVYQTRGENYSTDEDVNIGELYRPHAGTRYTRHGAHTVLTKGYTIEVYRELCKTARRIRWIRVFRLSSNISRKSLIPDHLCKG